MERPALSFEEMFDELEQQEKDYAKKRSPLQDYLARMEGREVEEEDENEDAIPAGYQPQPEDIDRKIFEILGEEDRNLSRQLSQMEVNDIIRSYLGEDTDEDDDGEDRDWFDNQLIKSLYSDAIAKAEAEEEG